MWFLFGVISLFAFTFYFGKKRFESNWVGTPSAIRGSRYTHNTSRNKDKVMFIQLGCPTDTTMDFSIKPETKLDQFFKSIGISIEHQVGKDSFDNALYLISDHSVICKALSQSSALQNEISNLFDICKNYQMELKELHIRNKRIWVKLTPKTKILAPDATDMAKDIVPALKIISNLFIANLPAVSILKDPFYYKAAIFLAISTGMGIMGTVHLITLNLIEAPFTVETGELFSMSLALGTISIALLITLMFILLGRTARTHLVLIELITIGYFGAVSSIFVLARDINIEWDSALPIKYEVQIYNKTISKGRRSYSYYLHVDDWQRPGLQKRLSVSSSTYRTFVIGEKLAIDQYPGYLGFKWVDEIKKSYSSNF